MAELPTHILTDAGFTTEETNTIVRSLVRGVNLHHGDQHTDSLNIDDLPTQKREALDRFNLAVAADG